MTRFLPLALLASCSLYTPDPGPVGLLPESTVAQTESWRSLAQAFLAWHYGVTPVQATLDGFHEHDAVLGDYSRADILGRAESLREYLLRIERVDRRTLGPEDAIDHEILEHRARAMLLEVEKVRSWERNPGFYRDVIARGLHALATRSFDTPDRRMALAAQRLERVPGVLAGARENLSNPPRVYTEIAIDEFGGLHAFLKDGLPASFAAAKDESVKKRFADALKPALAAVQQFVDWLRQDLLEKSNGEFAIGAETFRDLLLHEEGVETPLEDLLARGRELLRSTQEEMKRLAGDRHVKAVLRETSKDHAPADKLLDEARAMLGDLRQWAGTVLDLPEEADLRVQETPGFRRSLSFASMEVPGPFEAKARESFYSITLPDPSWPAERQAQHLTFFNRHALALVSVHEAYPGHYVQALAVRSCPSMVRRVFRSGMFSEGWAHYCEQLYAERPEATAALRLHQLSMALLRVCRYVAAIELHAKGMTYEQAVELFVNEGFLERVNAEREARRGTMDPRFLVYTLGKLEILALRQEYLRRTGRSLREFHNDLLSRGQPPIPLLRRVLLGPAR